VKDETTGEFRGAMCVEDFASMTQEMPQPPPGYNRRCQVGCPSHGRVDATVYYIDSGEIQLHCPQCHEQGTHRPFATIKVASRQEVIFDSGGKA
jgi:hypothetical protein